MYVSDKPQHSFVWHIYSDPFFHILFISEQQKQENNDNNVSFNSSYIDLRFKFFISGAKILIYIDKVYK